MDANADPLLWQMLVGQIVRVGVLYEGTPLATAFNARARTVLAPALARVGVEPRASDGPLDANLRKSLLELLGASGDPQVATAARGYVAKLRTDPAAIPPAIRRPILRAYASNATVAEWDALLALARAETSPVVRNDYINLLGIARDPALARRAIDLVRTTEFTQPQRAGLLAAIASRHPDLAFDFGSANLELVNGLLETSTRSSFVVQLGGRSNDPAMPAKIEAFAAKTLPETSRAPAVRTVNQIRNRAAIAERMRPAVTAWAGGR